MGRHSPGHSTNHAIQRLWGGFRIYWTVDRYYSGSRLRFPTQYSRDTDEAGARRFAKKWGVKMPESTDA